MMVLDTNVVSEIMRERPDVRVSAWLRTQREVALSAITAAEITYGIARLADGRRKTEMYQRWARISDELSECILVLDMAAAAKAGVLCARQEARGRHLGLADAAIAGTCETNSAALATRNIKDFEGLGIELVNPWDFTPAG